MFSVISAEALKLTRHRAVWGLVWIYPIVLLGILVIVSIASMSGAGGVEQMKSAAGWADDAADFWNAPPNTIIRLLVAGFVAIAFAGEYSWNTWKLVVPHRNRWQLIAAKYAVTFFLLLTAFILAAGVFNLIVWTEDVLSGDPIPQDVTAGMVLAEHWSGLLTNIAPLLLTIAYASFASVLTRSMVGALVVSIVLIAIEQVVLNLGPILSMYAPQLIELLLYVLPGYHATNIGNFLQEGAAYQVPLMGGTMVSTSLGVSLAVAAAWIIGFIALTFWRFGRQDIN